MIVVFFCCNSVFRFLQKSGIALKCNLEKMKLYNVVMNLLACRSRCALASAAPAGRRRAIAAHAEPEHETRRRTNGWGWVL